MLKGNEMIKYNDIEYDVKNMNFLEVSKGSEEDSEEIVKILSKKEVSKKIDTVYKIVRNSGFLNSVAMELYEESYNARKGNYEYPIVPSPQAIAIRTVKDQRDQEFESLIINGYSCTERLLQAMSLEVLSNPSTYKILWRKADEILPTKITASDMKVIIKEASTKRREIYFKHEEIIENIKQGK
jgi:hypothetical protein